MAHHALHFASLPRHTATYVPVRRYASSGCWLTAPRTGSTIHLDMHTCEVHICSSQAWPRTIACSQRARPCSLDAPGKLSPPPRGSTPTHKTPPQVPTPQQDEVLNALRAVIDPDFGEDIVACGFVKDLTVDGGRVAFRLELTTPACPIKEQFEREVCPLPHMVYTQCQPCRSCCTCCTGKPHNAHTRRVHTCLAHTLHRHTSHGRVWRRFHG